jgi:hypothetical protein
MSDAAKWFFWFRQKRPLPPGQWVLQGPFESRDVAKRAREQSKAWDADVSNVFSALSSEEARAIPPR